MKATKRDWTNFMAGFVTATIMALAVSDATGATHQDIVASYWNKHMEVTANIGRHIFYR